MDILGSLVTALTYFTNPLFLLWIFVGIVIGLFFGIVPGIGGLLALALLMPFMFIMTPETGLPFLLALATVTGTGGSITAILLNIPGTNPNAATCIDGYPMAVKGLGGRAVGASLGASVFGGCISGFLALLMIPIIIPVVMAVMTGDMVMIIVMGLAFIGILSGKSKIKGLISGCFGLLISFIGVQASTGLPRFTFDNLYLYEGLEMIPVVMGLFGLPELISLAISGKTIATQQASGMQSLKGFGQIFDGIKDVFRLWPLSLRCGVVGYLIGVIPGIGAEVATFVSYGQAKMTSKHPEHFGTGVVEGVIAPETASNGKEGGALLTTLALGIPGSSSMAIYMGAILMLGITPGPEMIKYHLPLVLVLILVIIAANFLGAAICFALGPQLSKVCYVKANILVPVVLVLICAGSFTNSGHWFDVVLTLLIGIIGVGMKMYGYSRPAVVLGFVLGFLFEKYFFMALALNGPFFFMTPISLTVIFFILLLFFYSPIKQALAKKFWVQPPGKGAA